MNSTDKLLQDISGKLDKLLRLQALEVVKDIAEEQRKIELLDSLGFRPIEIAKLLNKTPENVSMQLSNVRKKKNELNTKAPPKLKTSGGSAQKELIQATVDQSKVEAE